jgi:hypothetical protein
MQPKIDPESVGSIYPRLLISKALVDRHLAPLNPNTVDAWIWKISVSVKNKVFKTFPLLTRSSVFLQWCALWSAFVVSLQGGHHNIWSNHQGQHTRTAYRKSDDSLAMASASFSSPISPMISATTSAFAAGTTPAQGTLESAGAGITGGQLSLHAQIPTV